MKVRKIICDQCDLDEDMPTAVFGWVVIEKFFGGKDKDFCSQRCRDLFLEECKQKLEDFKKQ